jgi:putative phage-type endonuclease
VTVPITEKQRIQRRKWGGGSDVAALIGVDPWRNIADVWLEKRGQLQEQPETAAMEAGTLFEKPVLERAKLDLGPIRANVRRVRRDLRLACNIDGIVVETGEPVEVKTAGLFGPLVGEWGEDGSGDVPPHVVAQAHAHMIVTDKQCCHVRTFLGGRGFVGYVVERHEPLVTLIERACRDFWATVESGVRPDCYAPSMAVLRRVKRVPGRVVELPANVLATKAEIDEAFRAAKSEKDECDRLILAMLGDAEAGVVFTDDGPPAVTYYETTRKAYSVPEKTYRTLRLRAKMPEELEHAEVERINGTGDARIAGYQHAAEDGAADTGGVAEPGDDGGANVPHGDDGHPQHEESGGG